MAWVTYEHATLDDIEVWVVDDSDDADEATHPALKTGRSLKEGEFVIRDVDDTSMRIVEAIPPGYTAAE